MKLFPETLKVATQGWDGMVGGGSAPGIRTFDYEIRRRKSHNRLTNCYEPLTQATETGVEGGVSTAPASMFK